MNHLVLTDFDGTLANTAKDSPSGMNVHVAYESAVASVFGHKGLLAYDRLGGLKNREPGELVRLLQNETGRFDESHRDLTERLVTAKLDCMLPEIGPEWPALYPGVSEFLNKAADGEYPFDVGILSSGHDEFIKRALLVNGIDPEKFLLVTSDIMRERPMPERPRYKPHSYQLAEAHLQWLKSRGIIPQSDDPTQREEYLGRRLGKPNILYIGDDPVKDGGLAREARIPFIFVPNTNPDFIPDTAKGQFGDLDFNDLDIVMGDYAQDALIKGRDFSTALFGVPDRELFPPQPQGELYDSMLNGERER